METIPGDDVSFKRKCCTLKNFHISLPLLSKVSRLHHFVTSPYAIQKFSNGTQQSIIQRSSVKFNLSVIKILHCSKNYTQNFRSFIGTNMSIQGVGVFIRAFNPCFVAGPRIFCVSFEGSPSMYMYIYM